MRNELFYAPQLPHRRDHLVLLFLFWVPLSVFIYGFSALLGGLLLLTPLIALQVLVLKTLQRRQAPPAPQPFSMQKS